MARFVALILLAAVLWLCWALMLPVAPAHPQTLLITAGSSTRTIASELATRGVVRSRWAFALLKVAQPHRRLKAGEYRFTRPANAIEVFERIARGDVVTYTVVVPEGYNIFDIASAIEGSGLAQKEAFLAVARDPALVHAIDPAATSLEGYLYPATYQFAHNTTPHEIAATMVRRFEKETQLLDLHTNVHRVVTLASIVEKETAAADERPQIASVYTNRLAKHMALAADPTVIYAAQLRGNYRGAIYQSDLLSDSPYNTYRAIGMPPGPIANPGAASLKAAMHPASTPYLFFVAVGDGSGRHRFATNFEQHEHNVVAYRRATKAR